MKCILCGFEYEIKRSFKTLFNFYRRDICNNCIEKYKPGLNYQIIEYKNNLKIHWLYVFKEKHLINYHLFFFEISYLTKLALLKDLQFIYYDKFDDIFLDLSDISLMFNEIIVITFY